MSSMQLSLARDTEVVYREEGEKDRRYPSYLARIV